MEPMDRLLLSTREASLHAASASSSERDRASAVGVVHDHHVRDQMAQQRQDEDDDDDDNDVKESSKRENPESRSRKACNVRIDEYRAQRMIKALAVDEVNRIDILSMIDFVLDRLEGKDLYNLDFGPEVEKEKITVQLPDGFDSLSKEQQAQINQVSSTSFFWKRSSLERVQTELKDRRAKKYKRQYAYKRKKKLTE